MALSCCYLRSMALPLVMLLLALTSVHEVNGDVCNFKKDVCGFLTNVTCPAPQHPSNLVTCCGEDSRGCATACCDNGALSRGIIIAIIIMALCCVCIVFPLTYRVIQRHRAARNRNTDFNALFRPSAAGGDADGSIGFVNPNNNNRYPFGGANAMYAPMGEDDSHLVRPPQYTAETTGAFEKPPAYGEFGAMSGPYPSQSPPPPPPPTAASSNGANAAAGSATAASTSMAPAAASAGASAFPPAFGSDGMSRPSVTEISLPPYELAGVNTSSQTALLSSTADAPSNANNESHA